MKGGLQPSVPTAATRSGAWALAGTQQGHQLQRPTSTAHGSGAWALPALSRVTTLFISLAPQMKKTPVARESLQLRQGP